MSDLRDTHRSPSRARRAARRTARGLAILAILVGVLALQMHEATADHIVRLAETGGYPGILLAASLSGFNLLVPIPVITFLPSFVAAGLDPWVVVILVSIGMTLGDAVGAMIGVLSRATIEPRDTALTRWILRSHARNPRRGWIGLLLYAAFVPLPNELFVLPLSFLGFPAARILGSVLVGNVVFNGLNAALLMWGLPGLVH